MSCMLRIGSPRLNIDRLLEVVSLPPARVFRRGERRFPKSKRLKRVLTFSGANFEVSNAGFDDLSGQIRDAVRYLKKHRRALRKLMRFPGAKGVTLDFGIRKRDDFVKSLVLPPNLLLAAGSLGLEIEITEYPLTSRRRSKSRRA